MSLNAVVETLNNHENIKGKLSFDEANDFFIIDFNEYLQLWVCDDAIVLNNGLTHWHPDDNEDIIQDMTAIANGDIVFIERRGFFTRPRKWGIRICNNAVIILEKEMFEKRKEKYMAKKHLRIYSGDSIIKQSEK